MTAMYNADYTPDNWVVLKITNTKRSGNTGYGRTEQVLYKVLAGWGGGYLDGDSWRMNSGINLVFIVRMKFISMVKAGQSIDAKKEPTDLE